MATKKESTLTLHELASKSFNRSPNGLIFTEDLKSVFSVLIICLDLKAHSDTKTLFNAFTKYHPFSFTIQSAIEIMKHLEIKVDMNTTCINVSYNIKKSLALHLLQLFMDAKLLHTPADRTRGEAKEKVILQPTPKGVAILQKYARDIGLKKMPSILLSSLNSNKLFVFERSSLTDSIVHSDYLIHILFINLMGPSPNVWSPSNSDDKLPTLSQLLEYSNDTFTFENMNYAGMSGFVGKSDDADIESSWSDQIDENILHEKDRKSPLAHKFFTNPDSDSHVQYYVSDRGVRLFKSKVFGQNKTIVDYCFTTKALWQWLMDCTDIMYPKEAVSMAALLLKLGLIIPILLPPSNNSKKKFQISRSSYYTLSKTAHEIVQWNIQESSRTSNTDYLKKTVQTPRENYIDIEFASSGNIVVTDEKRSLNHNLEVTDDYLSHADSQFKDLDDILRDPGMRYLFRRYLEKDFCAENLDVYIEIKKFLKRMTLLKKIIESRNNKSAKKNTLELGFSDYNNHVAATIDSALIKQANECLEMAYHIYSSYIMIGAPYQLNIDHNLRESITAIMVHPQSPFSDTFPTSFDNLRCNDEEEDSVPAKNKEMAGLSHLPPVLLSPPAKAITRNSPPFRTLKSPKMSSRSVKPTPLALNNVSNHNGVMGMGTGEMVSTTLNETNIMKENNALTGTIKLLKILYPLLENVGEHIYKLMRSDSLQKFQNSSVYREIVSVIEYQE
ncbi:hypothetical protein KAFR_0A03160 [Kazachstania africana CBS 2517]|uniref:RGS domain-containing protein n=1 Tax=Kazachstania africana (strain ATCC 22294 / BCRC 22015 / CBS 2517 / CECT 1963 / NBRC 1671 / NRRL Y-8276) TaxID=1071382 RepID=H2AN01_KAZAF|nr:hypothetical protein KAFR_0A03160 [Kazachstania africana CBS 2517]CCF55751.1 hypothetical protein KAFR_0A03160 [Kazachstania africana CBS 2517]